MTKINFENGDVQNFGKNERIIIKKIEDSDLDERSASTENELQFRLGKFKLVNKDGQVINRNFKGKELKSMLKDNDGYDYYKLHRSYKITSLVFAGMVIVASLAQIALILSDPYYEDNGLLYLGAGLLILGELPCVILSNV